MYRKMMAVALLISLVVGMAPPTWAAASTPLEKLGEVEIGLYGKKQEGALLTRINSVEADLFGKPKASSEALIVRIENLANIVTRGGASGASLIMKLNAAEWMIFQTQTASKPLFDRLRAIEEMVYGQVNNSGGVAGRIDDLVALVWPGGALNTATMSVLPGTKVKVKLLTELSSTNSREGDEVRYEVVRDITVDNKVVIPAGAEGRGVVRQVKKAGPFGQEGQVGVEFGELRAMDGSPIRMTWQPGPSDKVSQSELAAGASLGGMVLLGPLGLAAGYLVQGKAQTIPVGAELTLEVKEPATVTALSLLPSQ